MTSRALAILGWSHDDTGEVESPLPQMAYSMVEAREDQLLYLEAAPLPQAASPQQLELLPCLGNTIDHGRECVLSPWIPSYF